MHLFHVRYECSAGLYLEKSLECRWPRNHVAKADIYGHFLHIARITAASDGEHIAECMEQ